MDWHVDLPSFFAEDDVEDYLMKEAQDNAKEAVESLDKEFNLSGKK